MRPGWVRKFLLQVSTLPEASMLRAASSEMGAPRRSKINGAWSRPSPEAYALLSWTLYRFCHKPCTKAKRASI